MNRRFALWFFLAAVSLAWLDRVPAQAATPTGKKTDASNKNNKSGKDTKAKTTDANADAKKPPDTGKPPDRKKPLDIGKVSDPEKPLDIGQTPVAKKPGDTGNKFNTNKPGETNNPSEQKPPTLPEQTFTLGPNLEADPPPSWRDWLLPALAGGTLLALFGLIAVAWFGGNNLQLATRNLNDQFRALNQALVSANERVRLLRQASSQPIGKPMSRKQPAKEASAQSAAPQARISDPRANIPAPPSPTPPAPRDIVAAYEYARSDESGRGRTDFETHYKVTRISCLNVQERKYQPDAVLRFEEHLQGLFLAVEKDNRIALFPGYSFEFHLEPETWSHMFRYPRHASARYVVGKPGRLERQGSEWILDRNGEGQFDNA